MSDYIIKCNHLVSGHLHACYPKFNSNKSDVATDIPVVHLGFE